MGNFDGAAMAVGSAHEVKNEFLVQQEMIVRRWRGQGMAGWTQSSNDNCFLFKVISNIVGAKKM